MTTYRMSSLGNCPRALSAQAQNYEPLPEMEFMKLAAKEGRLHETAVVEDLESEDWRITERQREVKLSFPSFELIGHIDGIALRDGDRHLLEIKSMSRFRYASFASAGFARFYGYAVQITCYHQAVSLPIMYVVKDRDSGKRHDLFLARPPLNWGQVYESVLAVEVAVRKKQLCPASRSDDFVCRTCPYRYLCEPEGKEVPLPLTVEVLETAKLRRRAMELEAEAKELRAECDPTLLAVAKQHGSFTLDDLNITLVPGSEIVSYPVAKLKKFVPPSLLEQVAETKKRTGYIRVQDLREA